MKPVKIRGFALPYGKPNSYNETIERGALDKFIADLNGAPIPMGIMHEGFAGVWTKLESRPDGLWCEGVITDEATFMDVKEHGLNELSITFHKPREFAEKTLTVTNMRAMPALLRGVKPPPNVKIVNELSFSEIELTEISLVNKGAYSGTHFEIVQDGA